MKCKHKRWLILHSRWPYSEGYGLKCIKCGTIIDTGLSKEQAKKSKKELETRVKK